MKITEESDSNSYVGEPVDRRQVLEKQKRILKKENNSVNIIVYEFHIRKFILDKKDSVAKSEIIEALSDTAEEAQDIEDKLRMMERFGIVSIENDLVSVIQRK